MTEFLNARPNFHVQDVAASIAFYRDVLGFSVTATMGEPMDFALLHNGGAEIALGKADTVQPSGCYVYVHGVKELHARLEAAGHELPPLRKWPWGNEDFVVYDPDGHMIAIGERTEGAAH